MTAAERLSAGLPLPQGERLVVGLRVQVIGPNIWGQPEDQGRTACITQIDVLGDVGVQFDDGCAPFGNWYPLSSLDVLA